ncbi:fatty acid desaturase, partial [Burkholderia cenocepacia]|nr:fatty acid desaturase [Burkholderia cenocepacia]
MSINTAHELGHKTDRFERWLAKITLAPVAYGHFYVEHNRGHHVRVATAEDPASARYGESFWAFLPRTVTGSIRSAWRLEKARLERLGQSPWTWRNEV